MCDPAVPERAAVQGRLTGSGSPGGHIAATVGVGWHEHPRTPREPPSGGPGAGAAAEQGVCACAG